MIDLAFLKRLIETVESSGIDTLEISRWGTRIRISKSAPFVAGNAGAAVTHEVRTATPTDGAATTASGPAKSAGGAAQEAGDAPSSEEPAAAPAEDLYEVTSPMVGTFYRAPAPEAPPYVEEEDRVRKGQTLCILEAMKLMNELESEVDGVIREICVENAQPVEYGQVLFRILPD